LFKIGRRLRSAFSKPVGRSGRHKDGRE
jgi:hypothetical protein